MWGIRIKGVWAGWWLSKRQGYIGFTDDHRKAARFWFPWQARKALRAFEAVSTAKGAVAFLPLF